MTVHASSLSSQPLFKEVAISSSTSTSIPTSPLMLCGEGNGASNAFDASSRLVIQPPMVTDSFSWEDFPLIYHQEQERSSSLFISSVAQAEVVSVSDSDSDSSLESPAETTTEDLCSYSSLSFSSMSDDDDLEDDDECDTFLVASQTQSSTTTTACTKRVRFASALEVRTYSVVLGDHPMCESLPLSLGWTYEEAALIDLETHEDTKHRSMPYRYGHSNLAAAAHGVHRLSYLERKHLLIEVGGYTDHQLMMEERIISQQYQSDSGCSCSCLPILKHSQRFESLQSLQSQDDEDIIMMIEAEASI
jgi:hypothetical protein